METNNLTEVAFSKPISQNKKLFSAAAAGLITRVSVIVIRFISLPLMLSVLSKERYGLWLIILSLVSWLGMSDLGIPSALQNQLIKLRANGETLRAHNLLAYGVKFLIFIGGIIFVVLGVSSFFLPLADWFSVTPKLADEFVITFLLCLFNFALALPSRLGGILFNVHGKYTMQPLFEMAGALVSFGMLLVAVWLSWNSMIALATCNFVGLIGGGFLATFLSFRKYNYQLSATKPFPEDKKALLTKGGFFFFTIIGELLILQSDALLIGTSLSASDVPLYLIPISLFINFLQLQNVWLRPLWPILTHLQATRNYFQLSFHFKRALFGSLTAAVIFGGCIVIFGDRFIHLWSNDTVGLSSIMAWGIAAYTLVASVDNLLATFLNAFGKIELRFTYTLVYGIIKLLAGWFVLTISKGEGLQWLPLVYAGVMLICSIPIASIMLFRVLRIPKPIV